ncbi:hypothetical protein FBU59_002436 [Linderina macrospora]|uniref:Uncharacterized protein n=1 Tax=Linderina macrospora TaxID=4868 RepID=A0ACC1JB30_9FUNG|nr:hypothetical protein FBU59_002436 [Linderina macrospora]
MSQHTPESAELLPLDRQRTQSTISAFSDAGAGAHTTAADSEPQVLYEDNYIQVSQDGLIIKRYYFPVPTSKFIPWSKIQTVQTAKEADVRWYALKAWGMGLGNIWWSQKFQIVNFKKNGQLGVNSLADIMDSNIVVKIRDQWVRCGCYVEYPQEVMRTVRRMLVRTHPHAE